MQTDEKQIVKKKPILLFACILFIGNPMFGQDIKRQTDLRLYKAIIQDSVLYFYEGNRISEFIGINQITNGGDNAYLRIVSLNRLSHPIYNDLNVKCSSGERFDLAFSWDIFKSYTYVIRASGGYHEPGDRYQASKAPTASLSRIPIVMKDTIIQKIEYRTYLDSIEEKYSSVKERFKAQLKDQGNIVADRNPQRLFVIENLMQFWLENMEGEFWSLPPNPFSYDFLMVNDNSAELFVRDVKGFSWWLFNYPTTGAVTN